MPQYDKLSHGTAFADNRVSAVEKQPADKQKFN